VTGEVTGTSTIDTNYAIKIPKGTTIYTGPVGYQGAVYLGGEAIIQTFIQEPWKLNVEVISKAPLSQMDNKEIIQEMKQLFEELLSIVEKHGDSTVINQKNIIRRVLQIINNIDINKYESEVIAIQREYQKLYPARGGLSEFYIWRDDFQERQAVNAPLSKIRKRLWKLLK
jgi:hypothetical protein